jgi:hypothetical protein
MRAQVIRARAGEARDARDLRSRVVLVPFDGPFWVWNHCSLWAFCLVCMIECSCFNFAVVCGVAGASGCVWPQNGEGS